MTSGEPFVKIRLLRATRHFIPASKGITTTEEASASGVLVRRFFFTSKEMDQRVEMDIPKVLTPTELKVIIWLLYGYYMVNDG